MARWTAKELTLNVSSTNEAIMFLEALQKQIKTVDIIADYFPGKVHIRFEGAKENLVNALEKTKLIHQMIRGMLYPDTDDYYEYNIEFLTKVTRKTFPIKTLLRILTLMDYDAFREEEFIVSDIAYKELVIVINKLDMILSGMPYEVSTSNLRNVLAIFSVTRDSGIDETLTLAKKVGIVKSDELNRLTLKYEADQALDMMLEKKNDQKKGN